jgi:mRNA interferase RelE/StbE
MTFRIVLLEQVPAEDIPRLSKRDYERIGREIAKKLTEHPEIFGKPLRRALKGYRALRVGDFRVVFRIQEKTVKIFLIAHRSVVYERYQ